MREIAALGERAAWPGRTFVSRHLPAICRCRSDDDRIAAGHELCLRLDCGHAAKEAGPYHFFDESLGDIEASRG